MSTEMPIHRVRVFGRSLDGKVASAHFLMLLIAVSFYVSCSPVDAGEATQVQILACKVARAVMWILMFPLGYLGYVFPADSGLQMVPIVLMPINSCLWGSVIVRMWRRCHRVVREKPTHC